MKIIGSMTYPAILAVVGVGVTIFLVMFVVPMFQEFFDRLERSGTGLPLVTVILVATSQFLVRYGVFVAAAGVALVVVLRKWMRTATGRSLADRWKLKIPVAGRIFHDTAVARLLPRPGHAAPQRSTPADGPAHQQRVDREPVAAAGRIGIGRDRVVRGFPVAAAGRLRVDPAPNHGDDSRRGGSEYAR